MPSVATINRLIAPLGFTLATDGEGYYWFNPDDDNEFSTGGEESLGWPLHGFRSAEAVRDELVARIKHNYKNHPGDIERQRAFRRFYEARGIDFSAERRELEEHARQMFPEHPLSYNPPMTRGHLELIARVLASTRPEPGARGWDKWNLISEAFSQELLAENPGFDPERFLLATMR